MGKRPIDRIYRTAVSLLEPGEIEHLEQVAAWQERSAWTVILDEIRRQHGRATEARKVKYRINRMHSLEDTASPISEEEPVLDRLVREERIQQLMDAIDRLPPHQQAAIRWHLAGHDYKGIGKLMGISTHTVEQHLRKGKRLLAYYLIRESG